MQTLIKRDPYAREELWRQPSGIAVSCRWCGSRPGRFTYAWVPDARHTSSAFWSRPVCSLGCYLDLTDQRSSYRHR